MTDVTASVTGGGEVARAIADKLGELARSGQVAMVVASVSVAGDAVAGCPVEEGALRASVRVVPHPDGARVTMGGESAPYAIYVHEDLRARHDTGGPRFLANALDRAKGTLLRDAQSAMASQSAAAAQSLALASGATAKRAAKSARKQRAATMRAVSGMSMTGSGKKRKKKKRSKRR